MAIKSTKTTRTIKDILDEQPKVSIVIPSNPDIDPDKDFMSVNINGYRYVIRCGENVEVPESVAKILLRSNKQISKIKDTYKEYTSGSGKDMSAEPTPAE